MQIQRMIFTLVMLIFAINVAAQDDELPKVVATTTQAYDIMTILAGDTMDITPLMGAGVDPHLYQPTESDIEAMNEADLVVYSGLNLEGQFETVFEALGESDTRIFALGKPVQDMGFTIGGFNLSEEFQNVDDPHFWFDPRNWQISVEALANELMVLDPDNTDLYTERSKDYIAQLDVLYEWGVEVFEQIPEEQRYLVTSHDAFQYFADAFGFEVRSIQGLSTADEAGVGDVQGVVDFVIENQIPVMFVESSVPPNTIESVQEAAESRGWDIRIGVRVLYSDAMGEVDSFGGTYIGMIGENIVTILQSFGYDVPEWPEDLEPQLPEELLEVEPGN
jgi:manganese/zinc/iron transport system substrate-binding protein